MCIYLVPSTTSYDTGATSNMGSSLKSCGGGGGSKGGHNGDCYHSGAED